MSRLTLQNGQTPLKPGTTWGCENTHCVRKRIYDAHSDMYLPEVQVLPFVSRSNEMVFTPDVTEGLPQGNVLGGWLNKSITLEAAGSPFYLKEDWTILPGVEVFIEPGVWIKPARDKGILVLGQIVARGEKGKRVAFGCQYQTAYCSYWQGLVFASDDVSTSPSELLFVDVFNAGYKGNTYGAAVQSFSPSIIIQNSRVIQSRLNGIELIGPVVKSSIIKRNEFLNNRGVGINAIVAYPRSVPLNTRVKRESAGWPSDLYGVNDICEKTSKMLLVNDRTVVYYSHGKQHGGCYYNCTRAIRSELGRNITIQILQFNLQRFQLEIFEGSSPLLSRRLRILYADQTNDSLPSDVPINSSSVTIRLYSSVRSWDTYGLQSMVFGIKISSDTSTGSIGNFVIEENTFFNNGLGGVNITTFEQSNWDININKNIFHRNGLSTSNRAEHSKAAIRLNIANTSATLANNYMEGNHGGIHATTHSVFQNNKLNIWSNQILFTTQIENILVAEIEDGPHTQQCSIDGNVIQHGQGDRYSDVLHLEGVSGTVTNNYIYNNTGLHVMWWTTPANRNTSEVTTDNIIYYSIARDANNMAAIVSGGSSSFLHDNVFQNPTFTFEMTSEGSSSTVNASSNWWGLTEHAKIKQRLRDKGTGFLYPEVSIHPIIESMSSYQTGPSVFPADYPRQITKCHV
ncbi:uncharacterized protein LOC106182059 [Lingula anatina]|uniref:Uncharacterized protein LOC106182059 n=1 Tax=Lingula anatina TaxID=7574 RepID=A0A1S3KIV5_LINAN|nr:uncharacterized protein LOC106182059 [Lingula anatina]|eukprot:XP_013422141.1 uncharacterized protein LOC106182059 [Lingula anatina]